MSVVGVTYVRLEEPPAARSVAAWSRVLSAGERERAARFVFDRDRYLYVAAHALVRLALSRSAPVRPEAWRYRTGLHGRPEVAGPEAGLGLRFSLSHTRGLAVCAHTGGTAVGVDAEAVPGRASLELAEHVCAPSERAALLALPPLERPERFLEYWTLKEALLKAMGLGLSYDPDRICFSIAPGRPPRVELPPELGEAPGTWQLESWRLHGRYQLALAVRSHGHPRRLEVTETPLEALEAVAAAVPAG